MVSATDDGSVATSGATATGIIGTDVIDFGISIGADVIVSGIAIGADVIVSDFDSGVASNVGVDVTASNRKYVGVTPETTAKLRALLGGVSGAVAP